MLKMYYFVKKVFNIGGDFEILNIVMGMYDVNWKAKRSSKFLKKPWKFHFFYFFLIFFEKKL